MQQLDIALDRLAVSGFNTRKDLRAGEEDSGIDDLASSIRQRGLLSPLIVRLTTGGRYEVIAGQRRLLACQRIGLDPVPCLVRDNLGDTDAATLSLVENVHRADMHPLDKARALKGLYDQCHSYERVAEETAWSVSTIRKYIQLLSLPEPLQDRLGTAGGPLAVGTLSRLAGTFSGDEAVEVYDKISGFTQRIQEEILKRSNGDAANIDDLVEEAHEGAFNVRRCGGAYGCEIIRDVWEHRLSQRDFQELVLDIASGFDASELAKRRAREAARAFWKALAAGAPE